MCRPEQDAKIYMATHHLYGMVKIVPVARRELIWPIVGVMRAHRHLARQRYEKSTSPLVARIPLALASLPVYEWGCQIAI
jgi:hypothetical protein